MCVYMGVYTYMLLFWACPRQARYGVQQVRWIPNIFGMLFSAHDGLSEGNPLISQGASVFIKWLYEWIRKKHPKSNLKSSKCLRLPSIKKITDIMCIRPNICKQAQTCFIPDILLHCLIMFWCLRLLWVFLTVIILCFFILS